jgi:dipeptide/tripeptide permease
MFRYFVFYFEGNETFEKLAAMSLIANLVVYLHSEYNMDNVCSTNVFDIWSGFTNFLPLVGAFIGDTYLGRFHILLLGTATSTSLMVKICFLKLNGMVKELKGTIRKNLESFVSNCLNACYPCCSKS